MYKNTWMGPADYQSRPFDMFIESVEKDGKKIPRFTLVTNSKLISALEKVKLEMYLI